MALLGACSGEGDEPQEEPDDGTGGQLVAGSGGASSGGGATGGNSTGGNSSGGNSSGGNPSGGNGTGGDEGTGGFVLGSGGDSSGGSPASGGNPSSGGDTGTGGAGTGGDSGAYAPCPASGVCKVMPLGDSITWGVGDEANGGYRSPLFASVVAAGQEITFTGSLSNGPNSVSGQPFPKNNEGHSGWGIAQVTTYSGGHAGIAETIPNPAFSAGSGGVPHIILLHIGTNDSGMFSANQMATDLNILLDKIVDGAPDALVVVAQIIPLGYGNNQTIRDYNALIPGIVQQRANAGEHITLVDMFTDFQTNTMLDGDNIHPNPAGYSYMAGRWYSVIGPLLP